MYLYGSVRTYIEDASSGKPTPGGGSAAALAGALGAAMACMAGNFTVGKKKFESVEPEVRRRLDACLSARDELLRLMDEDTLGYAKVAAAYAMPRETAVEKADRSAAIQAALLTAMEPPLQTVRLCRKLLQEIVALADIANPNLISDVGVAALLGEAALKAAKLNVEINLAAMKDEALAARVRTEIEEAAREGSENAQKAAAKVATAIAVD